MTRDEYYKWLNHAPIADQYATLMYIRECLNIYAKEEATGNAVVDEGQEFRKQRMITIQQSIEEELNRKVGDLFEAFD